MCATFMKNCLPQPQFWELWEEWMGIISEFSRSEETPVILCRSFLLSLISLLLLPPTRLCMFSPSSASFYPSCRSLYNCIPSSLSFSLPVIIFSSAHIIIHRFSADSFICIWISEFFPILVQLSSLAAAPPTFSCFVICFLFSSTYNSSTWIRRLLMTLNIRIYSHKIQHFWICWPHTKQIHCEFPVPAGKQWTDLWIRCIEEEVTFRETKGSASVFHSTAYIPWQRTFQVWPSGRGVLLSARERSRRHPATVPHQWGRSHLCPPAPSHKAEDTSLRAVVAFHPFAMFRKRKASLSL